MKRRSLVLLLLLASLLPLKAQQMSVEEYARLKRPLWHPQTVTVDRSCALLDLVTDEKGFTFLANGSIPAEAEEGDGVITVKLPHKTAYLTIRHPDFGQMTWRVPDGKRLRKNRHYRAFLFAGDPTRDFSALRQWVVFHLDPGDAVLQVDSLIRPVRGSSAEFFLPLGPHTFRAEAPFHEPVQDSFTLTDSVRADIRVHLQPFYSYLTVKTAWQGGDLFIDNAPIRKEEATSYRLSEGHHRVAFYWGEACFYDSLVFVERAQKKVLELQMRDLYPRPSRRSDPFSVNPPSAPEGALSGAPVKLTAADPESQIWVDREPVGKGVWEGTLTAGFHLAQTVKDGLESDPERLWVEEGIPQEILLHASGTGYGLLNIHCNVAGARIRIDGTDYGEAPRMVRLEARRRYKVMLSKNGYKNKMETVRPRGNHLVDVYVKLKKDRT